MESGMPLRFEGEKEEGRKIALIQKEVLRDILKVLDFRKTKLHWEWERAVKLRDNAEKSRDLLLDYYKEKVVEVAAKNKGVCEAWELVWSRLKELERKTGKGKIGGFFEMSMIGEVADKLKKYAAEYNLPPFGREVEGTSELLLEAAKMIEILSAKLEAASMKRSDKYYGGGWIACEERLPEDDTCVLVQVNGKHKNITFENAFEFATYIKEEGWVLEVYPDWTNPSVVAWMPLPKPYHEF